METKPTYSASRHRLSCIRDDRVLFEGLAFELVSGQVLLLEGKNGSGKTSLLRILCGFREPDAGQVLWCGDAINDSQYYEDMAYVGHLDGVKKELTVLENLKVSLALGGLDSIPFNRRSPKCIWRIMMMCWFRLCQRARKDAYR